MVDKAAEQYPQAAAQLGDEQLRQARSLLTDALTKKLGDVDPTPRGSGAKRWDEPLARVGLGEPATRPIPVEMDNALAEVIQLRHVVAHRAGRVDVRALKAAPSLRTSRMSSCELTDPPTGATPPPCGHMAKRSSIAWG